MLTPLDGTSVDGMPVEGTPVDGMPVESESDGPVLTPLDGFVPVEHPGTIVVDSSYDVGG